MVFLETEEIPEGVIAEIQQRGLSLKYFGREWLKNSECWSARFEYRETQPLGERSTMIECDSFDPIIISPDTHERVTVFIAIIATIPLVKIYPKRGIVVGVLSEVNFIYSVIKNNSMIVSKIDG